MKTRKARLLARLEWWDCHDLQDDWYVARRWSPLVALLGLIAFVGCDGAQSALEPAGRSAEKIARLFWGMAMGALLVWSAVVGLAFYCFYCVPGRKNRLVSWMIIGGGTVVPSVVLGFLLAFGLTMLPDMLAPALEGSLRVKVTGEQWWWRIEYESVPGEAVVLANEIRLPVGEPVEIQLESSDVVHSFWIPSLGGKMDMIPGRRTRLKLEPTRTGSYRGACAEYCGGSHAWMLLDVVVSSKEDFDQWLDQQRQPAKAPTEPVALSGRSLFLASGCGACHTVRGTSAEGKTGPDLTHVGGRLRLGAGVLGNEVGDFARWIEEARAVKPDVHMPSFRMLGQKEIREMAAYLDGLE